jgi:hypothetical protein
MTTTETTTDQLLQALLEDPDFLDKFRTAVRSRGERPFFNMAGERIDPLATTPKGRVQVSPGQTISSASWGNPVWDQSVNCFNSISDRDAQWPTPHDGAMCYTADTGTFWRCLNGVWSGSAGPMLPVAPASPFVSFTDGGGEVWVAKGGVNGGAWKKARDVLRAKVYRNAAGTVTQATGINMGFDVAQEDPYGLLAPSPTYPSGQVTVPIAGRYLVLGQIRYVVAANQGVTMYICNLARNGTIIRQAGIFAATFAATSAFGVPVHAEETCAAGDTLTLCAGLVGTSTGLSVGAANTYMHVIYMGTG